ncbi:MAG: fibronectin type III domain-containing protein [Candidatus Methylumidiphilus sp.]
MQPKLIATFDRHGEADFLAKTGFIIASLADNSHFPEHWIEQVPSLAQLGAALTAYRDAYHASQTRDTLKIAQRDIARQALTELLKRLAPYLELVAAGDTAALTSTGYDLRKEITRTARSGPLPAPADFRVSHGPKSGSLDIHAAKLQGAGSYEVQIAQGDPTAEAHWQHALSSTTSAHILLEGLTPAQTYWLRLRGISGQDSGLWTEAVSVIVI